MANLTFYLEMFMLDLQFRVARPSFILFSLALALLLIFLFASYARAEEGTNLLSQRSAERKQQRWQLSDYLADKAKMREQDYLYRLYTTEKTKPQVEPYLYALAATGFEKDGDSKREMYHLGYGASLHFNHLVSGLTGWRTPNIVMGGFVEKRDVKFESSVEEHLSAGGSLRFFARNHSDSAIFLNYTFNRRPILETLFREWVWDVGARIYVLPFFGLEGGASINQNFLQGNPSERADHRFHFYGVSIEASSLRVTLRQENRSFRSLKGKGDLESEFTSLALGIVM